MMAAVISTGSPKLSRKSTPSARFVSEDFGGNSATIEANETMRSNVTTERVESSFTTTASEPYATNDINGILARLRINDTRTANHPRQETKESSESDNLDRMMNDFSEQQKALKRQEMDIRASSSYDGGESSSSHGSDRLPRPEHVQNNANHTQKQHATKASVNSSEILQMRQELEKARFIITRQERELNESRNLQHTMDQAMGSASDVDFALAMDDHMPPGHLQSAFNAAARPFTSRKDVQWPLGEETQLETTNPPTILYNQARPSFNGTSPAFISNPPPPDVPVGGFQRTRLPAFGQSGNFTSSVPPRNLSFAGSRPGLDTASNAFGVDEHALRGVPAGIQHPTMTRGNGQMRSNLTLSDPLSPVMHAGAIAGHLGGQGPYGFQERPYNGPLSPLSPEFPSLATQSIIPPAGMNSQTYVTPLEPMNYRRLLDKSVSCDWKYIVDKIVCNNDQQASIFLQQKLKVGTAEQKFEIVESIVNQAYPLMINRFGNFLVQRCFEHGTPDQIISIANAIHGNVISLSMDPFGCHVIQKAFDSIPEEHKSDMVRELLRRIPDTVIHRYACHVWQKLFELRWSGEPPQIMVKVNEALRGMWHEVALGETGSLVVQNIFENCVEEEKRPAIEEVTANIDLIAHGQFGNWCIQHLCEHGSPPDRRRVVDHILENSYNYSIDQFASKVVEKCLKIGGPEFLDRYLTVITTARPDRPRIPLIDIAGDQYGNYLIQWILMNTHQQQREQVAIHIRKHMVSLRGSKFGSRVAMLCGSSPAATRPGPSAAIINPYGAPGQPARNNAWPRYR